MTDSSAAVFAATLVNIEGLVWNVVAADGRLLVKIEGGERYILGPAKACLVADYGYPRGEWVTNNSGGYRYEVLE